MFQVVTIAREYGSGGAEIGRRVAETLGWELLDRKILERAAALCEVDRAWVEQVDEKAGALWERILSVFRNGGPETYFPEVSQTTIDRDALQQFTLRVIEEAATAGHCVIVGRASQCILRPRHDSLHVMVYAPFTERLERVRQRHPDEKDLPGLLRRRDLERIRYTQDYYGQDARDRSLYQLMLNSTLGLGHCVRMIVESVQDAQADTAIAAD